MASYVYKDSSLQCVSLGMDELVKVIDFYVPIKFTAEEKVEFNYLVNDRHNHKNKDILDKLDYDEDNDRLTYNGEPVHKDGITEQEVYQIVNEQITSLGNVTEDDKKAYDDAVDKAHSHKNKEILDKFDYDSINGRVMYDGVAMTGSGMIQNEVEALVDEKIATALQKQNESYAPITATEKADYDEAVVKSHIHTNGAVLDAITQDETTGELLYNENPICKGLARQEVEELIDEKVPVKLKEHTVEEYNQAVQEMHVHYNKNALELFSYTNGKLYFNGKEVAFVDSSSSDSGSDSDNDSDSTVETGVYAFQIDQSQSDSSKMITYLGKNADYTPVHMDCENGVFDYGSWENVWFIKNLKPCVLNYDGTVAYELDKNDYSKKKDGTPSNISDTSINGNVMVGIPKVYYKVVNTSDDIVTIYISDTKVDSDYHCWSHINEKGEEIDYCYISAYFCNNIDGKLRSISGQTYTNSDTCLTYEEATIYAQANYSSNNMWNIGMYSDYVLIMYLSMLIGKNIYMYSQETFGFSAEISTTNILDNKGLFYGSKQPTVSDDGASLNYDGCSPSKIFGLESYIQQMHEEGLCGIISPSYKEFKVKMTYGTEDGSIATGYNSTGEGYISATSIDTDNSNVLSGNIKKMSYSNTGFIPNILDTNAINLYYRSIMACNAGDENNYGRTNGFSFYFNVDNSSKKSMIRFRLSCKPLNKITN